MNIITVSNLTYKVESKTILDNVTINIPNNSIYGFIGPNGAGKSTTIKSILGLIPSVSDKITFSKTSLFNNKSLLENVGSLIETPSLYEHLSAKDNLKIYQYLANSLESTSKLLDIVNLKNNEYQKVKTFSMGMKQRLGIAIAMINNPDILILDEPLNGLDPEGIHDMRMLFLRLKSEGKTIVISSHLLLELELVIDYLGIINKGKIVFEGSLPSLKNQKKKNTIKLKVNNISIATKVINDMNIQLSVLNSELILYQTSDSKDFQIEYIISCLKNHGVSVLAFDLADNLESRYFELLNN